MLRSYLNKSMSEHESIIPPREICHNIFFLKSIEFGMSLKWNTSRYKLKTEIFFVTRPPFAENILLVYGFFEKNKKR